MITIIDNELGNVSSIANMLNKLGIEAERVKDPNLAAVGNKIILPGVGAFDHGMSKLDSMGWKSFLNRAINDGTHILGICLGMQLLFENSEEGSSAGLGFIPGNVIKFKFQDDKLKIPHMGWNVVRSDPQSSLIVSTDEQRFYHVHSYHAVCKDQSNVIGVTHYGYDFPSIVQRGKIFGVQFHPEKSHKFGMALLANFSRL